MPGSLFTRDAQRAWGFVFDQERRHSSLLPHAGALPTYLRPIREPTSARVRTIHTKARLLQTPHVGREITGGHAVIYQPATGLGERPPTPHVVPLVCGIYESNEFEVRTVGERDEGITGQTVGMLASERYREAKLLVAGDGVLEHLYQDY